MNYFDTLEKKRNHVKTYRDQIPPKELLKEHSGKRGKQPHQKITSMAYQD